MPQQHFHVTSLYMLSRVTRVATQTLLGKRCCCCCSSTHPSSRPQCSTCKGQRGVCMWSTEAGAAQRRTVLPFAVPTRGACYCTHGAHRSACCARLPTHHQRLLAVVGAVLGDAPPATSRVGRKASVGGLWPVRPRAWQRGTQGSQPADPRTGTIKPCFVRPRQTHGKQPHRVHQPNPQTNAKVSRGRLHRGNHQAMAWRACQTDKTLTSCTS